MFEVTCIDKYGNTVTNLTQWDLNQTLYIEEHVFTTAPQFHFCNKNSKKALVVQSELKDGILEIDVPNILLTEPYTITMYLYLTEGDSSKTVEFVQIPVRQRPQPDSFEYEDNVVVIDIQELANEIRALNDSMSSAEEGRVNAENVREANELNRQAQEKERQNNVATTIQDVENAIIDMRIFEEGLENAEALRQSQEEIRQSQESDRQTNTATAIQNANNATDRANIAAEACEGIISGTGLISSSEKGIANGVATLDSNALIPIEQLPEIDAKTLEGFGADHFLPKTGGTVEVSVREGLIFRRTNNNILSIRYEGSSGKLGEIGFAGIDDPVFIPSDGESFNKLLHTGNMGDHVLPIDGSKRIEAPNASVFKANNKNGTNAYIGLYGSGNYIGGIGFTGNADYDLEVLNKNGSGAKKIIHTGNVGDYALPKTGGTIEKNAASAFGVKNTNSASNEALITFSDAKEQLGMLGFKGKNTPIFYESGWTNYRVLIHNGNVGDYALLKNGGGVVSATNTVPLETSNTNEGATECYVGFKAGSSRVYIGMKDGKPRVSSTDGWGDIIHTGNSAKVHIGSTAPSDTSSLWVDTSV